MSKLITSLFLHFEVELADPKAELKEVCWYAHYLALDDFGHKRLIWYIGGL